MEGQRISVNRAPCAMCTTKNKVCRRNCKSALYFPAEKQREYESAHELFGTPTIMRMMRSADDEEEMSMLASSILMEGEAWTKDPVKGAFGIIQKLKWKIAMRKIYLDELHEKIKAVRKETKLGL
ncbi:hypothetical protein CARUB_v10015927mg [Capsella rubella]|uniref:LOB domain-containing protein n=1 Tax=Capsella rubella TaxID=81985 RepID=R0GAA1_9BRAS|nr:LOB domain-containing protein 9 [Capsella rubella]EOA32632.1 hypothetical protein CARUB_v10015927mg [Capsella rubella]